MSEEQTALRLARAAAQAADAWLKDPLDTHIYQRLVQATLAWRAFSQPMLEGTENAGRRLPASTPEPLEPPEALPASRAPRPVGDAFAGSTDPRDVLRSLAGRPPEPHAPGNEPSP